MDMLQDWVFVCSSSLYRIDYELTSWYIDFAIEGYVSSITEFLKIKLPLNLSLSLNSMFEMHRFSVSV